MSRERSRQARLVAALSAAVLLAVALVYASFSAGAKVTEPSDLLRGSPSGTYQLTGTVVHGSIEGPGPRLRFEVADRDDPSARIPVRYSGQVPDPFREGREVILTGTVCDRRTKRLAEEIAESARGVKDVDVRIRLTGTAADTSRDRDDKVEATPVKKNDHITGIARGTVGTPSRRPNASA